jgi:hypothetical protein
LPRVLEDPTEVQETSCRESEGVKNRSRLRRDSSLPRVWGCPPIAISSPPRLGDGLKGALIQQPPVGVWGVLGLNSALPGS